MTNNLFPQTPVHFKAEQTNNPIPHDALTEDRKNQHQPVLDQIKTPNRRGIIFFDTEKRKHAFPIYRDAEIGITAYFQRQIHSSGNDDDRMTTSTQMGLAISQTCEDLFQRLAQKQQSQYSSTEQDNRYDNRYDNRNSQL